MRLRTLITILSFFTISTIFGQSAADYYKKADNFYDKKDFKNALQLIDLALKTDSINATYLLLKGNSLEELGDYKEAFIIYTKLIDHFPKDVIGLNQRALLLNKVQEFELAIKDFNKALNMKNPDSVKLTLYVNRGAAKINSRNFQGAYDDFMVAYLLDTLNIGTLNNLAAVCDEVGKGDKTLGYLYKILKIDSTFIGAYGNIGFKFQEMGDYKTAIQYYDKVLLIAPNDPLGFSNRAYNRYKLNELKEALTDINKSLLLYPANSYAFRIRALIYLEQNRKEEACTDINKALELGFTKMYGEEMEQLKMKNCK